MCRDRRGDRIDRIPGNGDVRRVYSKEVLNSVFIRYVMNKRYNDRGRTTAAFPPTTKFSRLYVSLFRTSWSVGRDKIIPAASEPRTAGNSLNL